MDRSVSPEIPQELPRILAPSSRAPNSSRSCVLSAPKKTLLHCTLGSPGCSNPESKFWNRSGFSGMPSSCMLGDVRACSAMVGADVECIVSHEGGQWISEALGSVRIQEFVSCCVEHVGQ